MRTSASRKRRRPGRAPRSPRAAARRRRRPSGPGARSGAPARRTSWGRPRRVVRRHGEHRGVLDRTVGGGPGDPEVVPPALGGARHAQCDLALEARPAVALQCSVRRTVLARADDARPAHADDERLLQAGGHLQVGVDGHDVRRLRRERVDGGDRLGEVEGVRAAGAGAPAEVPDVAVAEAGRLRELAQPQAAHLGALAHRRAVERGEPGLGDGQRPHERQWRRAARQPDLGLVGDLHVRLARRAPGLVAGDHVQRGLRRRSADDPADAEAPVERDRAEVVAGRGKLRRRGPLDPDRVVDDRVDPRVLEQQRAPAGGVERMPSAQSRGPSTYVTVPTAPAARSPEARPTPSDAPGTSVWTGKSLPTGPTGTAWSTTPAFAAFRANGASTDGSTPPHGDRRGERAHGSAQSAGQGAPRGGGRAPACRAATRWAWPARPCCRSRRCRTRWLPRSARRRSPGRPRTRRRCPRAPPRRRMPGRG